MEDRVLHQGRRCEALSLSPGAESDPVRDGVGERDYRNREERRDRLHMSCVSVAFFSFEAEFGGWACLSLHFCSFLFCFCVWNFLRLAVQTRGSCCLANSVLFLW